MSWRNRVLFASSTPGAYEDCAEGAPVASRLSPLALRTLLSNRIDESESESGRATSGLARGSRGRDQRSLVSHYCILLLVRSCGHYARPGGRVRPARRSRGRSAQACTSPDGCKCGQMKRPFGQLFAGVLQLGCSTDGTQTRISDVGRYVCVCVRIRCVGVEFNHWRL